MAQEWIWVGFEGNLHEIAAGKYPHLCPLVMLDLIICGVCAMPCSCCKVTWLCWLLAKNVPAAVPAAPLAAANVTVVGLPTAALALRLPRATSCDPS